MAEPRAAVLSISTSRSSGEQEDESGPTLRGFALEIGAREATVELVPDDQQAIEARLRHWSDDQRCQLILTTGGTGFGRTDFTPEATRAVIDREAPGIAEAMRAASRTHTKNWMLSRGVAGIRGTTLIINFPGSPSSIEQAGTAIATALPHALALMAGAGPNGGHHGQRPR